jgi:hypothetical protein
MGRKFILSTFTSLSPGEVAGMCFSIICVSQLQCSGHSAITFTKERSGRFGSTLASYFGVPVFEFKPEA